MSETGITPAQCRAARAMLRWSQPDLATKSGAGIVTIQDFESEKTQKPRAGTLVLLRLAFEEAGIVFIEENGGGAGVRLLEARPKP